MGVQNRVCAIVLAGGSGSRMGLSVTKQQLPLLGRSVLYHAVRAFEDCPDVNDIVVVCRKGEEKFARGELSSFKKIHAVVTGGEFRAASAERGFSAIPAGTATVAIHDAARALITPDEISRVILAARECGAASAVSPVTDTVKEINVDGIIVKTLDRDVLRCAQTPQVFSVEIYKKALGCTELTEDITDDNMLVERSGVSVRAVEVGRSNIKITTREDLAYAEFLLKERNGTNV